MFRCDWCGWEGDDPVFGHEYHGLPGPYHETFPYCPCCNDSVRWANDNQYEGNDEIEQEE